MLRVRINCAKCGRGPDMVIHHGWQARNRHYAIEVRCHGDNETLEIDPYFVTMVEKRGHLEAFEEKMKTPYERIVAVVTQLWHREREHRESGL